MFPPFFNGSLRKMRCNGFSLVEIVIAIGVVSFAFIAILGLLPSGLKTFRSAIDISVSGQIFQSVLNDAQQTDFTNLITTPHPIRYFDDQGIENTNTPIPNSVIYYVNTYIQSNTALTATSGTSVTNTNVATVTVQIANNPAHTNIPLVNNLWTNPTILTHSTMVSRSK